VREKYYTMADKFKRTGERRVGEKTKMNNFKSGRHQENMHRKGNFVSLPGVVIYLLIVSRSLNLETTGSIG
jgi:hypothetical protein